MGSSRPSRPAQLDPAVADGLAGGMDPQALSEMSHLSAAALLDRVRHSEDPAVVERVLTLVETVGVDEIAELWSDAEPDSLPGVLWRLYMLRTWMRSNRDSIAHLWRLAEPVATTASAIAGVGVAVGAPLSGAAADRWGQRATLLAGALAAHACWPDRVMVREVVAAQPTPGVD